VVRIKEIKKEFLRMEKASNPSTNTSTKTNAGAKGVLLVVGAYVATIGVAACITSLAFITILMEPPSCSAIGQALLVLWGTIAALFLASVAVVGVVAWKIVVGVAGRLAIMAVYGVLMLVSYVVIAFGLMVAFNC
jgi:hypothetical protein